jgi:hypothetical protein
MLLESKDQLERERLLELDRRAWNVPSPPVVPAGPVREVWPVHPSVAARGGTHDRLIVEDPAAA